MKTSTLLKTKPNKLFFEKPLDFVALTCYNNLNFQLHNNDCDGIMLLFRGFQRAGGWCEPVQKKECSLIPESTLRRIFICVVEYGRPVTGFGLDLSPRETVYREETVNKVVPRSVYSSLKQFSFKDFFCTKVQSLQYATTIKCARTFLWLASCRELAPINEQSSCASSGKAPQVPLRMARTELFII